MIYMPRPPTGLPKGRPPQPYKLKVLHGLDKTHPELMRNGDVVTGEADERPPDGLSTPAAEVWTRVIVPMIRTGMIRSSDTETALAFCNAAVLVKLTTVRSMREESGRDQVKPGRLPAIYSYSRAIAAFNSLGARLGLSPVDRSRLAAPESEEFDDLLSGPMGGR